MNHWKRIAAFAVAAMLLVTGCAANPEDSWAYRTEDQEMPIGLHIYSMMNMVSEAQLDLQEANEDNEDFAMPETYSGLLKLSLDGKSMGDLIAEKSAQWCREYFALEREFASRELELGEAEQSYAETQAEAVWENAQELYEDNGIAVSSLRLALESDMKRQMLFQELYGTDGEQAVGEEELIASFLENYALADVMLFLQEAGEEKESEMPRAEEFLERLEKGEDFYDLVYEFEKDEDAAEDQEKPEEGSREVLFHPSQKGTYSEELLDGVFAAEIDKPTIVEDADYIFVLRRKDALKDDSIFENNRGNILRELRGDIYDELVAEWAESVELEANQSVLDRYPPSRLKI